MQPFLSLFDAYLVEKRGIAPLERAERDLLVLWEAHLQQDEKERTTKKEESDPSARVAAFLAAHPSLDRSLLPYERVLLVDYARFRTIHAQDP